jgi:hypothetical protein
MRLRLSLVEMECIVSRRGKIKEYGQNRGKESIVEITVFEMLVQFHFINKRRFIIFVCVIMHFYVCFK